MRLDRLRGYGPWFAFAVPFIFLLSIGFLVAINAFVLPAGAPEPPGGWLQIAVAAWLLLWGLMVLAGLVVAVDLEFIEHPRTNSAMTYVGLAGMAVATVAALVFLVDSFSNVLGGGFGFYLDAFLVFAGFGVYLTVMNLVAMRARLLGRVLPWIGLIAGALFLVAALMIPAGIGAAAGFGFIPGWVLYLGWSLWLGFRLRGKAPEAAAAAPMPG